MNKPETTATVEKTVATEIDRAAVIETAKHIAKRVLIVGGIVVASHVAAALVTKAMKKEDIAS
jgi:hypothetical protein